MKINRRFLNIAILSLIVAMILTVFAYMFIKRSIEPEKEERIAYFKYDVRKGTNINSSALYMKDTPVSLIPKHAIKNPQDFIDKRVVNDAYKDDFALSTDFIVRGETSTDVDDMFHIGIDIDKIANFLGTQLKEGDYYGLLYLSPEFESEKVYRIKLINMVDGSGRVVLDNGESNAEEINIAVELPEEVREIAEKKRKGSFELIKIPEDKWTLVNDYNLKSNEAESIEN